MVCNGVVLAAGGREEGLRYFIAMFAALSAFNLSYRIDAKGKRYPENIRNFWDTISICVLGIQPKDPKKGGTFRIKAIPKRIQDLMEAFSPDFMIIS